MESRNRDGIRILLDRSWPGACPGSLRERLARIEKLLDRWRQSHWNSNEIANRKKEVDDLDKSVNENGSVVDSESVANEIANEIAMDAENSNGSFAAVDDNEDNAVLLLALVEDRVAARAVGVDNTDCSW